MRTEDIELIAIIILMMITVTIIYVLLADDGQKKTVIIHKTAKMSWKQWTASAVLSVFTAVVGLQKPDITINAITALEKIKVLDAKKQLKSWRKKINQLLDAK